MTAMRLSSVPLRQQGDERPHPGRRQGGENGDGVDVALIQYPQYDVNRQQRRQDQVRFVGQGRLEGLGRSQETPPDAGRQPHLPGGGFDGRHRIPQGRPLGQIEGDGDRRKLAQMVDR